MRKRQSAPRVPFDRRIGLHDRLQFELKLEYQPSEEDAKSQYIVELYMFIPASLNVTPDTAPTEAFYADIHNYVRLKTPQMSWSELQGLPDSPLVRLAAEAEALQQGGTNPARFTYECKLFSCVFRATLRDFVERVEAAVASGLAEIRHLDELGERTIESCASALAQFRRVMPLVTDERFPERAGAAARLTDEYVSLIVEQMMRRAIERLEGDETGPLRGRLFECLVGEEAYRKERGYPTILSKNSDNEEYVHRAGLLKKYGSSALFLKVQRLGARKRVQDLVAAIAAGIAMAFATVIAFWAQARYGQLGLQLFVILVLAYMFKDRIKEGARGVFSRGLDRFLYDRKTRIADPEGGTLGTVREKSEYVAPANLPEEVKAARYARFDPVARVAEEELDETIYHYRKRIALAAGRLRDRRGGAGVTDIVRFHVGRLLREMDEPMHAIHWVSSETHEAAETLKAAKVYHVDVVFRFVSPRRETTQTSLSVLRLVLDRRGVKRVERVDQTTQRFETSEEERDE